MSQKRKVQDAFGKPGGQLSAIAAARLAKLSKVVPPAPGQADGNDNQDDPAALAVAVGATPYDGHHSDDVSSGAPSAAITPAVTPTRTTPCRKLSTFALEPRRVLRDDKTCLEISMTAGEIAVVAGEYTLEVIKGTATIYGGAFHGSSGPQRVYAPSVQALPPITARRSPTVIRISSVKSSLAKMEKLSPLFRNIWTSDDKGRSFAFLETSHDDPLQRSLNMLETDSATQKVFTQLTGKAEEKKGSICAMTLGPKSSGKSTFNRQLCNALLTTKLPNKTCLYLDLDPGQPEFGPAGQISLVEVHKPLLGPSFTNQASASSPTNSLLSSHTLAATTFKDDPDHYIACIRELALHVEARRRLKGPAPIIINACGWTTGLGAAVLADLYDILPITDTVAIEGVDATLLQTARARSQHCFNISRAPPRSTVRSPAELRAMQTMAYFHSKPPKGKSPQWSSKPLSSLRPWIVRYGSVDDDDNDNNNPTSDNDSDNDSAPATGIFATMSYGQSVPAAHLAELLDGSLVALVTASTTSELSQAFSTALSSTPTTTSPPPKPTLTPLPHPSPTSPHPRKQATSAPSTRASQPAPASPYCAASTPSGANCISSHPSTRTRSLLSRARKSSSCAALSTRQSGLIWRICTPSRRTRRRRIDPGSRARKWSASRARCGG